MVLEKWSNEICELFAHMVKDRIDEAGVLFAYLLGSLLRPDSNEILDKASQLLEYLVGRGQLDGVCTIFEYLVNERGLGKTRELFQHLIDRGQLNEEHYEILQRVINGEQPDLEAGQLKP